jgi:glycosyltransferase involved in cell wall biosynthesis
MQKKRIGLISAFSPPLAGMPIQAFNTIDILRRENHTVFEINTNPQVSKIYPINQFLRSFVFYIRFFTILPVIDTLIIYANRSRSFYIFSLFPIIIGKLMGKNVIVEFKSGGTPHFLDRWGWLLLPVLNLPDLYIEPSEYLAGYMSSKGFKARVVPDVIRLNRFNNEVREKPEGCNLIVTRNLDSEIYGIDVILKAFPIIKKEIPEAELWILGSGPLLNKYKRFSEKLPVDSSSIQFLGFIERDNIPDLYDRANILLNASREDNTPNSLFEAMASGLPIVTTPAQGIKHIVKNNQTGLLFTENDHQELADKVIELYNNHNLYHRLSRNALKDVYKLVWDYERDGLTKLIFGD